MDILEAISDHRSVRKFKTDPVAEDMLTEVLEAGIRASSYGNMNSYSLVVSRDQETRERLFLPLKQQQMVRDAPVQVTFCSDFRRMRKWLAQNDAPDNFGDFFAFMIGAIDAVLVSQNVALAAEAKGLGICYIGATLGNAHLVGEVLELPAGVVPVTGFSLGWPDEEPQRRDRLPFSGLVHYERYHDHTAEEIEEIYRERNKVGWDRYMANARLRQMIEESDVENLAQVYTRLKYTPEAHERHSASLLAYLRKQGFMS
ncbi:MAG: nitroreductase family protein [Acidimicrobiia bacterium]|nr:nitroreductase family protein [Acidimicrobiia bacterium]